MVVGCVRNQGREVVFRATICNYKQPGFLKETGLLSFLSTSCSGEEAACLARKNHPRIGMRIRVADGHN